MIMEAVAAAVAVVDTMDVNVVWKLVIELDINNMVADTMECMVYRRHLHRRLRFSAQIIMGLFTIINVFLLE